MEKKGINNIVYVFVKLFFPLVLSGISYFATGQAPDSTNTKDTSTIENITVTAFHTYAKWAEVPAAIAILDDKKLQLINYVSLVPGLNIIPGVRMEERSPGSYRLSIRGSLLRSPFGVRNVKIYWNDIPFTDAGGNTYLQLVDISQVKSIEIIKGPASSLYGANTGGALIMHPAGNSTNSKNVLHGMVQAGSFGLFNQRLGWEHQSHSFASGIQQSHTKSNGYRKQSALRKDALLWNGTFTTGNHSKLMFLASYTDLFYETPGGINYIQMQTDPTLPRQATATLPGAEEQKASIRNKTVFAGATFNTQLNTQWDYSTTVMLSHTDFRNPFITNYEIRNEWNAGARTTFRYHKKFDQHTLQWLAGGEWQQNYSRLDNYRNHKGTRDTVLFKDKIYATQYFLFTQVNFSFYKKWVVQAGTSSNKQLYSYNRLTNPLNTSYLKTKQNSLFTPRLSLLYKLRNNIAAYAVAARGFSPPSLGEIRPSDGNYYPHLQPEAGWNYEAGIKGSGWENRFLFDASVYYFRLKHAIVRRVNAAGDEYFINAGSTMQKGLEAWAKGYLARNPAGFLSSVSIAHSFSYQPYFFDEYISGSADLSGKRLTGVPSTIHVSTAEIQSRPGLYANVVYNFTSAIPLNDANDEWASRYRLLQVKIGLSINREHWKSNIFIGVDNILNERYSLGNDINAAGRRYYNPAPPRNYFAGFTVTL